MRPKNQPINRSITTMISVVLAAIYHRASDVTAQAVTGTATIAISSLIGFVALSF